MFKNVIGVIRAGASFLLMVINTLFWFTFLVPISLLKLIVPIRAWRNLCNTILDKGIATNWIMMNNLNLALTNNFKWEITGLEGLERDNWYLVLSNHQSWSDILVLQKVFNREIPFLKFFLKKELLYVPVMGLAWWALDFPFMKRYTKEYLEAHPEKKGKDLETTKIACEKYKTMPVSVMNFVEGTRFTKAKHEKQNSPYKHLLRPKAAGIAFVLSAMGDCMQNILDVTIVYPEGVADFWGFLAGKTRTIRVHIRQMPITDEIKGDYFNDAEFQKRFQDWINKTWAEKDLIVAGMLEGAEPAAG